VTAETLHWKDLSLDELEQVLKSEEVTGEPEEYEYIRQDGILQVFNDDCSVNIALPNEQVAATPPDGPTPQAVEAT